MPRQPTQTAEIQAVPRGKQNVDFVAAAKFILDAQANLQSLGGESLIEAKAGEAAFVSPGIIDVYFSIISLLLRARMSSLQTVLIVYTS